MAVLDLRHGGEQRVPPRHLVDIDLHDAQVRHGGGEVDVHHRAQVAVEVVRRDVDLAGFRASRDLHGLRDAVPHRVDNRHVHRAVVEIGLELAQADQRLAAGDGRPRGAAHLGEADRVVGIDLVPEQFVRVERVHDLQQPLGAEVEVEVQQYVHVGAGALAERFDLRPQRVDDLALDVQVGLAGGHVEARRPEPRPVVEKEHVGLQAGEARLARLAPLRAHIVERGQGRRGVRVRVLYAVGAAMRPVDPHPVAHRPAEQFVDGDSVMLRLDVEEGVLNGADRLAHYAARRRARRRVEQPVEAFGRSRVLADDLRRERFYRRRHARRAEPLLELAPADHAVIGRNLAEREVAPPRIRMQGFDGSDLHHGRCLRGFGVAQTVWPAAQAK